MLPRVIALLEIVSLIGTFSGTAYFVLCIWSARRFLCGRIVARESGSGSPSVLPPVSILKPLKGTDPEMYESFRSHCLQDYPDYEIIFGVSDPADPTAELVERLKLEFPQRAIRLLVSPNALGSNVKVSNLAQMASIAKYDYFVVNDGDIRVPPDYLLQVISPLLEPKVGLVTCLYRGVPGPTLGSRLESLGISTDFSAGVLAAQELEGGIRFGLGSTLAFRREVLKEVGGFESLLDFLADDYELGVRISATGRQVHLASIVVDTFLPAYSFRAFFEHQLRWARGVRDSRPWGYFGLLLTFGVTWALLLLLLARGAAWAWLALLIVLFARTTMAMAVGRQVLRDPNTTSLLWLLLLRDAVAVLVWAASYAGHTIHWRGDRFVLKNGRLTRIEP